MAKHASFNSNDSAAPVQQPRELEQIPRRRRRSKAPLILLLLLVLGVGGFFGYQRFGDRLPNINLPNIPFISDLLSRFGVGEKTVTITLNGEETQVAEGSTVQDVFDATHPSVVPGNLMSVAGNVIGEGQGDAYAATLNGALLPMAETTTTVVTEGATLSFANGANKSEEFTTERVVSSSPKLVRRVQDGLEEAGPGLQTGVLQYVYQWGKEGSKEVRTGTVSGETADGDVVEGQDCIIMCQNIHPDNDEKLVALTFDDGPTNYTQQYLDILAQYDIKCTFNLIGEQVEDCADAVRATRDAGHQICSHTWTHPDLPTLGGDEVRTQLADTFAVIKSVADYDTTSIRAPYGDINFEVWAQSNGLMTMSAYWTHDSEDWKLPGVDQMVANCTSNMAPGSVILMHDGGGNRDQDVEALPRIIEAWQAAGYRFVTMEELLASDSSIPEECRANNRPMPSDAVWPTETEAPEATEADDAAATEVE